MVPLSLPFEEVLVIAVEIGEKDRLDSALRRFRRQLIRSGLFADMRRKRFYEKPSEARKSKVKAAQRRRQRMRRIAQRGGRSSV